MQKLQDKINELEKQGLSKKEITSQTQDLFEQVINEPLSNPTSYTIDLQVTLSIDSKMKQEKLQGLLHEPIIKKLILELDDEEVATEVLYASLNGIDESDEL